MPPIRVRVRMRVRMRVRVRVGVRVRVKVRVKHGVTAENKTTRPPSCYPSGC